MKTFRKPKPEKQPTKTTKKYRKTKFTIFTIICLIIIALGYLMTAIIIEYKNTHTFTPQTPIIIRTPIVIERNVIISPVSTQSGMMKAYAQEYKNPFDVRSPRGVAWGAVKEKWGVQEWGYFEELIMRESGWNPYAINQSSGACGLGQALPCSKLGVELWDYEGQIKWIVNYISNRYATPAKSLEFHDSNGWY